MHLRDKIVRIRKEHRCFGCCRKRSIGTKMRCIVSVDGGSISSAYWCSVCDAYYDQHCNGQEISMGGLIEADEKGWNKIRTHQFIFGAGDEWDDNQTQRTTTEGNQPLLP